MAITKKTRLRLHLEHDLLNTRISMTSRIRDPKSAKKSKAHKLTPWQQALCHKLRLGEGGGTIHVARTTAEAYAAKLNGMAELEAKVVKTGQVDCIEIIWKQRLNHRK